MATFVQEKTIDDLPSLTPEEAKARGITNYFDVTQQEGAADERGMLRIQITPEKKPDDQDPISQMKWLLMIQNTLHLKKKM